MFDSVYRGRHVGDFEIEERVHQPRGFLRPLVGQRWCRFVQDFVGEHGVDAHEQARWLCNNKIPEFEDFVKLDCLCKPDHEPLDCNEGRKRIGLVCQYRGQTRAVFV